MSFRRIAELPAPPAPACTISSSPSSSTDFSLPVGARRMNLSPISMEPASAALFWPAMASWICLGEMPVVARRVRGISRYTTSGWSPSISILATSWHSSSSRRRILA